MKSSPARRHSIVLNERILEPEDGLILGNGDLSVSVYQTSDRIIWRFGKGDVWDRRLDLTDDPRPAHIDEVARGIRDEGWKCGPYGGHRLNELAEGWFNVAHDHPDANHFMIFWKGQMWATDDGYPKQHKAGENHNLVLVDGKGPLQRGAGWLQPIPNMATMGKIDTVVHKDGLFAARGDATNYYPDLTAAFRWLAVVRDRYVVICDHLAAGEPRQFQWLLHSDADCSQDEAACFSLTKGDQRLRLRFALPTGLVSSLEEDILEGRSRGHVLRATPPEATRRACFVAVFAMAELPALSASEDEEQVAVNLGEGITLGFEVASGEVSLR